LGRESQPPFGLGAQAVAAIRLGGVSRNCYSAWGRNPAPVDLPGRRRKYVPVGLDAASLPHTLPGKSPRPGLLIAVAPRSRSNLHVLSILCLGTRPLRTGRGEFFLDLRRQEVADEPTGRYSWRVQKELTEPWPLHRSKRVYSRRVLKELTAHWPWQGAFTPSPAQSLPAADCAPLWTTGDNSRLPGRLGPQSSCSKNKPCISSAPGEYPRSNHPGAQAQRISGSDSAVRWGWHPRWMRDARSAIPRHPGKSHW